MRGKEIFNMSEVFNNNEFTSEPSQQSSNSYPYSFEQPFDAQQQPFAAQPQPSAPVPEQKKKSGKAGKIVALLLACALVGGGSGFGAAALMQKNAAAQPQSTTQASSDASVMLEAKRQAAALQVASVDTGKVLTPSEVYAQNVNSTVGITTSITTNYFGYQTTSAAAGSGFILTQDGYILTNYHVVEGSNSIKVTTYDGTSYDAQLIGYDESNDIAVLKIDATDLTPVVLGDSDTLNVGDSVVAIGNPLGELTFSLTTGVVSALDRPVTLSTGTTMNLIQTDCAINSGNSGGALFNLYGEVIGITNAKYSSSGSSSEASIDNIGFAIPIDQVRSIFESIITNGYIVKPYIGVTVSDVSSESQSYGLPQGAAVRSVTENGPAAEAGLQENDIITAVNGETITGSNDLVKLVKASAAGDTLELTVYRQGQTTTLTLTVGEQKTDALPAQTTDQNQQSQQGYYDGGQSGQSDNQFGGSWPFGFGFGGSHYPLLTGFFSTPPRLRPSGRKNGGRCFTQRPPFCVFYLPQQIPAAMQEQPDRERPDQVNDRADAAAQNELRGAQQHSRCGQDIKRQLPLRHEEPDHAAELHGNQHADHD